MEYMFTYVAESQMVIPQFNTLKVDNQFLFYALCYLNCQDYGVIIYHWTTAKTPNFPTIISTEASTNLNSGLYISYRNDHIKSTLTSKPALNEHFKFPLAYISPITYIDQNSQQHLAFFSGSGDLSKGTCGDIFVHDIVITSILDGTIDENEVVYHDQYLLLNGPSYPLSNYAASLMTFGSSFFYLIHGGISCDYITIYSNIFAIDVLNKKYIQLKQKTAIQ
jgi:hypothetical protein